MHGITANAHVFEPLMERLADRFRVVSVDQRGHGRSDKPEHGYRADDYSGDLLPILKEKALLIGHSLGARNALAAGLRYPESVAAVVAIDFTPFIEKQVFDELDARVAGGDRVFSSIDEIESYLAGRYRKLPADAVRRRARHGYEKRNGKWYALASPEAMIGTCAGLREDLSATLKAIGVPTLLVRGKESRLVSPDAWAKTRALRPDLRAMEIEGADHYVPEEQPEAVAAAVLEFWESLEERRKQ
jgi:2-(acetamidomethylene)succinate hydrolase